MPEGGDLSDVPLNVATSFAPSSSIPAFIATAPPRSPSAGQGAFPMPVTDHSLEIPTSAGLYMQEGPVIAPRSPRTSSHNRNASHSLSIGPSKARPLMKSKKSLPDLRRHHAEILADRHVTGGPRYTEEESTIRYMPSNTPPVALERTVKRSREGPASISKSSSSRHRPISSLDLLAERTSPTHPLSPVPEAPATGENSPIPSTSIHSTQTVRFAEDVRSDAPNRFAKAKADGGNAGEVERNSGAYFRRLSMLPPSTIAKAVPTSLLQALDAVRGILFALSQIYSALKQFVIFATQDRMPASLAKVMTSADGSMSRLINALDRFDSVSRRDTPVCEVIVEVFSACRENVTIFGKLVSVLGIQLKVLLSTADVRYTRTLLLMLHGSMGEISHSWNALQPLAKSIVPLISGDASVATVTLQPPTPSPKLELQGLSLGPLETSMAQGLPPASSASSSSSGPLVRSRSKSRRHAGSFSVEDVQLGAIMPPASAGPLPTQATPATAPIAAPITSSIQPQVITAAPASLPLDATSTVIVSPPLAAEKARPRSPQSPSMKPRPGAPKQLSFPSQALSPALAYKDIFTHLSEMPPTPLGAPGTASHTAVGGALPLSSSSLRRDSSKEGVSAADLTTSNVTSSARPVTAPARQGSFAQTRPAGTLSVDEDFLEMVDATTNVSLSVCNILFESLSSDAPEENHGRVDADQADRETSLVNELLDMCAANKEVTTRLKGSFEVIAGLLEGQLEGGSLPSSSRDVQRFWDDCNGFVKASLPCMSLGRFSTSSI